MRKFLAGYETLDDLLEELQQEIVDSFTSQNISYKSMADIKRIIRYFYEYAVKMPKPKHKTRLPAADDGSFGA